ncbi:hypothetical protein, partial [Shewanella intestini]|uniref:hypothetical protein n=1 Tax=Shewanella sp. XMDDZSB0408 TaxID=2664453 RepID=UPI00188FD465
LLACWLADIGKVDLGAVFLGLNVGINKDLMSVAAKVDGLLSSGYFLITMEGKLMLLGGNGVINKYHLKIVISVYG